jgi:hypothetical protein
MNKNPKFSFVVLLKLDTPFWYPNHEWILLQELYKFDEHIKVDEERSKWG